MDANFFKANRHHLVEKLQGGSVVLTNYTNVQRSADMAHTFESESNFWWLSGIEAADWWLIIDGVRGRSTLVAPKISDIHAAQPDGFFIAGGNVVRYSGSQRRSGRYGDAAFFRSAGIRLFPSAQSQSRGAGYSTERRD